MTRQEATVSMLALCGLLLLTVVGTVLTVASTEDAVVETRAGVLGSAMALAVCALIVLIGELESEARMRRSTFQHYVNQQPPSSPQPPTCNNVASGAEVSPICNYVAFTSTNCEATSHDNTAAPAITSGARLKADMVRAATLVSQHGWCTSEAKRILHNHPLKDVLGWLNQGGLLDRCNFDGVLGPDDEVVHGATYCAWYASELNIHLDDTDKLWVAPEGQSARPTSIDVVFDELYGHDARRRFTYALIPCIQTLCDERTGVCSLYIGEYAQLWRMPQPGKNEWERMLPFEQGRTTSTSPKYSVAYSYICDLMR